MQTTWQTWGGFRGRDLTASGRPARSDGLPTAAVVTAGPADEPLTLAEACNFVRQDVGVDDALILTLVRAARQRCERVAEIQLVTATLAASFDGFARRLLLPRPLRTVAQVQYLDAAGATQSVSTDVYRVLTAKGLIEPKVNQFWPAAGPWADVYGYGGGWDGYPWATGSVVVTCDAGYGDASAVPAEIKAALLACVAHMDRNRDKPDVDYLDRLFLPFWSGVYR